jgi:putative membrane protein
MEQNDKGQIMHIIADLLAGFPNFLLYFSVSIVFVLAFKFVYIKLTPYDEWQLIKEEQNTAAAVALSGAFLGYCLAIAGAAKNSVSIIDFMVWGVVALLAQLIAFGIVRFILMPKVSERIENNEVPAGIVLAAVSVSVGVLNAACMTY